MPGGRPRTPLKVLEMSGATKKNPGRYRARVAGAAKAKAAVLGDPPQEWIEGTANGNGRCVALLKIWNDLVAQDVLKVLNISHRMLLKNTCQLQYKVDRASAGYGKATSGDYAQITTNLSKMGMTPVDSSRVAEAVRVPDQASMPGRPGAGWGELVG